MVVTPLVWFRDRLNRQGKLARAMSRAAYAVYILHTPVIIFVAWALRSIQLDLALKFVLVAPVAVALCFVVGHYATKFPLARNILWEADTLEKVAVGELARVVTVFATFIDQLDDG